MSQFAGRHFFTSAHRFSRAQDYARLLAQRGSLRGEYFQLTICSNEAGVARLGLIVGRKLFCSAVARNYCKRLVRESFRQQQEALHGLDVLVRSRLALNASCAEAARQELRTLFGRGTEIAKRGGPALTPGKERLKG